MEWALSVTIDEKNYKYYIDENSSDDNCNTMLFCDGVLISDNYMASNDLIETLAQIYNGTIVEYKISEAMRYNFVCMMENGQLEY